MNISRIKARDVAEIMTSKIKEEIKELQDRRSAVVRRQVLSEIPKAVMDCFRDHPGFFVLERNHYVQGHGMSREWGIRVDLPTRTSEVNLTPENAAEFVNISNQISDLKKKENKVFKDIVATLLTLKTYNRVKEAFPEAYALLPNASAPTGLPVVRIDAIREQLGLPSGTGNDTNA